MDIRRALVVPAGVVVAVGFTLSGFSAMGSAACAGSYMTLGVVPARVGVVGPESSSGNPDAD